MMCMLMHAMHGDHAGHQQSEGNADESLLDILKRRYALGQINEDQFEQMKRVLGLSPSAQTYATAEHTGHADSR